MRAGRIPGSLARLVVGLLVATTLGLPAASGGDRAAAATCDGLCVLDRFDERVNGSLRTQGPWRTNQPGATDGAWATDEGPVGFSGKVIANQPDGIAYRSNASAALGDLAVPDGATGTLFLELSTDDVATTALNLGLSDVGQPGLGFDSTDRPVDLGDFEVQVTVDGRGLVVRDGAVDRPVDNVPIASGRRYFLWLVVDNAADTYALRVQPAGGEVVEASAGGSTRFAFRTGTADALVTYLNLNDPASPPTSVSYVDNLFVAPDRAVTDNPAPLFEEVVDLEAATPGAVDGQDGWVASDGVAVAADPTGDGNQVLAVTGTGRTAHRALPAIEEGAEGTLFFRMRRTGTVDLSAGLSDQAAPTAFSSFEAQANVQNSAVLNARDGGAFAPAGTFADQAWQCVWLVADTASDAYELHVRGGAYEQRVQLPEDAARSFGFRNGANAAALARLFLVTGSTSPGTLHFDDFAADAGDRNLRVPSGDPADCPGGTDVDAPLADPIPGTLEAPGLGVTLTEFAQIPASSSSAPTARINHLGELPDGSGRLYVPDLYGSLYMLDDAGTVTEYLDVAATFPDFVDRPRLGTGLTFAAFHPDFADNGRFYTAHTESGAALTDHAPDLPGPADPVVHGVVVEWTADDPAAATFRGTHREVLRIGYDTFLHGLQEINFNRTAEPGDEDYGLLYIANGDGEENPNWTDGPQNLGVAQGKILRIDPDGRDSANGAYGIPAANPFAGREGALGEIFQLGLRNPHRFGWDALPAADGTHEMYVTNIGEANIDSAYLGAPGDNFGWNVREGAFRFEKSDPGNVYALPEDDQRYGFTYPVAMYDHDSGRAIAGGSVYRGTAVPELYGKYVFGDIVQGTVFYAETAEMDRGEPAATVSELELFDAAGNPTSMTQLAGRSRVDLRLGEDAEGELYVLSKANGRIWKVGSAAAPDPCGVPEPTVLADVLHEADWDAVTPASWSFTGEEAVLEVAGTSPQGPRRPFEIATLAAGPEFGAVQVDAAVRLDTPPSVSNRDVVMVFGYQSPTQYYYAHISQDNTIYAHNGIFRVDDADRFRIDDQWDGSVGAPPAITDAAYHNARVRHCPATGRIEVYVDDLSEPLMTATDRTFDHGRVGFGSFDNVGRIAGLVVTGEPYAADPVLGVAQRVSEEPERLRGNRARFAYEFTLKNLGDTPLTDVRLANDLVAAFGERAQVSVASLRASDGLRVDPGYDGVAARGLLAGGALAPGEVGTVELVLIVKPGTGRPTTYLDRSTASALSPAGVAVEDASTDGTDPDPDGDGAPTEQDPTPVRLPPLPPRP